MFVTSAFPRWLRKVTADGKSDVTWGSTYSGSEQRSGYLDVTAHEVWQVGSNHLVASVGDGLLYQLSEFIGDGTPDPAFGTNGTVTLPYEDGKPLRVAYDQEGGRFLVVVARAWETTTYFNLGPSKIELLAYDEKTGAVSSAGLYDLPHWRTRGPTRRPSTSSSSSRMARLGCSCRRRCTRTTRRGRASRRSGR